MDHWLGYAMIGLAVGAVLTAVAFGADVVSRLLRRRSAFDRLHAAFSAERESSALKLLARRGNVATHPFVAHLFLVFSQSGGAVRAPALMALAAAVGAALFFALLNALGNAVIATFAGLTGAVLAPYLLLRLLQSKRRSEFVKQLPESIDVVVRSLRAGHPLSVAIGLVGRDMAEPAGVEFAAAAKEMSFGLDLESATHNMAARVGSPEVKVLASAISIQQRTGGNLAEVLSRLATLLRDRARLRARAKALSAEGRVTGLMLSALPFVMFLVLNLINPNYYGDVRDNAIVAPVLVFTVCWMAIGIVIIQRMVNIRA